MISEYLSECSVAFMPSASSRRFHSLTVLEPHAPDIPATPDEASPADRLRRQLVPGEPLYCGRPSEALTYLVQYPHAWIFVIFEDEERFEAPRNFGDHLILCRTSSSYGETLERLQHLFQVMASWVQAMKTAILQGGSYQNLLNCSEDVLGNFISISDSEFRLLAYTRNTPIDDPISQDVVRLGYHAPEIIEQFRVHNALRDWQTQTRIETKPAGFTVHPTMDYVFRSFGNYFLHVVMQCNVRPPTPALRDTFQLFVEHVGFIVRQARNERSPLPSEPSALFADLIERRHIGQRALQRRLKSASLTLRGAFSLVLLDLSGEGGESSVMTYYAQQAKTAFPNCAVGIYQSAVIIVDSDDRLLGRSISQLQAFINLHGFRGGVSEPFEAIEELADAYHQARHAIELGSGRRPSLAQSFEEEPSLPLYWFRDYLAAYAIDVAKTSNRLITKTASLGPVAAIVARDREQGTEDAKILYFYLRNERNVRLTCEELFMHRSSLLYRIKRLEERFGLDLDNASVRQRLLTEYLVLPPDEASNSPAAPRIPRALTAH